MPCSRIISSLIIRRGRVNESVDLTTNSDRTVYFHAVPYSLRGSFGSARFAKQVRSGNVRSPSSFVRLNSFQTVFRVWLFLIGTRWYGIRGCFEQVEHCEDLLDSGCVPGLVGLLEVLRYPLIRIEGPRWFDVSRCVTVFESRDAERWLFLKIAYCG